MLARSDIDGGVDALQRTVPIPQHETCSAAIRRLWRRIFHNAVDTSRHFARSGRCRKWSLISDIPLQRGKRRNVPITLFCTAENLPHQSAGSEHHNFKSVRRKLVAIMRSVLSGASAAIVQRLRGREQARRLTLRTVPNDAIACTSCAVRRGRARRIGGDAGDRPFQSRPDPWAPPM